MLKAVIDAVAVVNPNSIDNESIDWWNTHLDGNSCNFFSRLADDLFSNQPSFLHLADALCYL